jgi:hypothetical protein
MTSAWSSNSLSTWPQHDNFLLKVEDESPPAQQVPTSHAETVNTGVRDDFYTPMHRGQVSIFPPPVELKPDAPHQNDDSHEANESQQDKIHQRESQRWETRRTATALNGSAAAAATSVVKPQGSQQVEPTPIHQWSAPAKATAVAASEHTPAAAPAPAAPPPASGSAVAGLSRAPNEWTLLEIKRFFTALEQYNSSRDFEKMAAVIGANKNASQVKNFYYKCLTNLKKCYSGTGSQVSQRNPTAQMELLLKYWHLVNSRPSMLVAERSVFSRKITNQLKDNLLRARQRITERANIIAATAATAVAATVGPTAPTRKMTLLLTPHHAQESTRRLQYDLKPTKRIKDLVQRLQSKLSSSGRDSLRLLPASDPPAARETPALSWDA